MTCNFCGQDYTGEQRSNRPPRKYCSRMCGGRTHKRDIATRFWNKIDRRGNGCWLWPGAVNNKGYGMFQTQTTGHVKFKTTHRLAWELTNGPIPVGLFVCHTCDVPSCVNPAHLWLGTNQANIMDAVRKGRHSPPYHTQAREAKTGRWQRGS